MPEPAVALPRLMAVPPLRVMAPSSKVMLCADWVLSTVTVPAPPPVPAEKKRSSAFVVVSVKLPPAPPVESVFQRLKPLPQVPVAAPEFAAVLLVSQ